MGQYSRKVLDAKAKDAQDELMALLDARLELIASIVADRDEAIAKATVARDETIKKAHDIHDALVNKFLQLMQREQSAARRLADAVSALGGDPGIINYSNGTRRS